MTDLQIAKQNLVGHTICLCKLGECITDDKRGISPIMGFIADGIDLRGYSAADVVVGKAAALMFVKCGIVAVYAKTLSEGGKSVLERYGIPFECDELAPKIINRAGTDVCPMEKAVWDTFDPEAAYTILKQTLLALREGAHGAV